MSKVPQISEAEWQVMGVVWDRGPSTAQEVVAALHEAGHDWHERTIKTMLNRLLKKEALAADAEGKRYVYRAAVRREACVKQASRSFLDRVFGGDAMLAMVHLAKQAELSPHEVDQLQRMLSEKEKRS